MFKPQRSDGACCYATPSLSSGKPLDFQVHGHFPSEILAIVEPE
jgi:hypothetical protein